MDTKQLTIKMSVDTTELDEAIMKCKELLRLKELINKKWWQFWK